MLFQVFPGSLGLGPILDGQVAKWPSEKIKVTSN